MAPCDAMAEIRRLEAVNAAMRERDTHLTERMAAQLLENQRLEIDLNLHKRAVEWCIANAVLRDSQGRLRWDPDGEDAWRELDLDNVPAELAEVILGSEP